MKLIAKRGFAPDAPLRVVEESDIRVHAWHRRAGPHVTIRSMVYELKRGRNAMVREMPETYAAELDAIQEQQRALTERARELIAEAYRRARPHTFDTSKVK